MLVRVVDYVGNAGGGLRFTVEMLRAFTQDHPEAEFEFVSYGAALARYRRLVDATGIKIRWREMKPQNYWWRRLTFWGLMGLLPLPLGKLGRRAHLHHSVPGAVFDRCDVVWLPWLHGHRLPRSCACPVVGSFHDVISFQIKGGHPEVLLADEAETNRLWFASPARIVVSSRVTQSALVELLGILPERVSVIPLSGEHAQTPPTTKMPPDWSWSQRPFLICPANTGLHKNHEVVLKGVAAWGARHPLVLTGRGTDLLRDPLGGRRFGRWSRRRILRKLAEARGLVIGNTLIPLGYVSNEAYYSLLTHAWALIMPTLAEGGGSFPVWEAMQLGVPVVCSDIPVMREQLARTGGEVLWFDPHDPNDLAKKLNDLEVNYEEYKTRAVGQVNALCHRSWKDVVDDYWSVFISVADKLT